MPLASAVCSTYGRKILLAEALKCFLDQDYPNKELIVLNDEEGCPIELDKDYPEIRVVNVDKRFKSLGEKRQYGLELIRGDYYFLWEDDELCLPWRISKSVEYMEAHPEAEVANPVLALSTESNEGWRIFSGNCEGQGCIRRTWTEGRTYNSEKSVTMDLIFQNGSNFHRPDVSPLYWYIYRWGLNIYHLSGSPEGPENWENAKKHTQSQGLGVNVISPGFTRNHWMEADLFLERRLKPDDYEKWSTAIRPYLAVDAPVSSS